MDALFVLVAEVSAYAIDPAPNVAHAAHGYGALYGFGIGLFAVRHGASRA